MTNNKTKKIVVISILTAISVLCMEVLQFSIIPSFSFLKVDLSIVPVLVGMYTLGFGSAMAILLLRSAIHLFISPTIETFIGLPMNIVAMTLFILGIWIFSKKGENLTHKSYIFGGVIGTVGLTIVALVLNLVYAMPLYSAFMHFTLPKEYITVGVLPFNLLQGVILVTISGLILFALQKFITKEALKFQA